MASHTYNRVQDLPDEFLEDRADRHHWRITDYDGEAPIHWKNSRGTAIFQKRCSNCGGKKYFYVVRKSGEYIEEPVTRLPREYYLPAPETRAQRNLEVRKEYVFRYVPVSTNGKK